MGIPSLLNLLKSIVQKRHIKDYKNQTIAVDVYTWLHPAVYTCAYELANNIETTRHIDFCVKRVEQLLWYGIKKIVLVFDGRQLPSKKGTEMNRERNREASKLEAQKLLAEGKKELAHKKFASSVDVTPQMAYQFIQAIKGNKNVECIVSPYEADAQLAYLSKTGYVDVVLSEDSDLLTYGCKKVLFKMFKGDFKDVGDEISLENLSNCKDTNMNKWDQNMFLTACILTGCDYLPSLKKMGINTAFKLVGDQHDYKKCLQQIRSKNFEIPSDYDSGFEQAFLTFRFQQVYCPLRDKIVHLNSPNIDMLKAQYLDQNSIAVTDPPFDWASFEANILPHSLIIKILSPTFSWAFLGDMDEVTAMKVAKYEINPDNLQPYERKTHIMDILKLEGKNMGTTAQSSGYIRQTKGFFDKNSRWNNKFSTSDQSLLSLKPQNSQNTLTRYLKVADSSSCNNNNNPNSQIKSQEERKGVLLEDVSVIRSRGKAYQNQSIFPSLSIESDSSEDPFLTTLSTQPSKQSSINLLRPFKIPSQSSSQSQNSTPSQSGCQLTKQKSNLKRGYKELDYFRDDSQSECDESSNNNTKRNNCNRGEDEEVVEKDMTQEKQSSEQQFTSTFTSVEGSLSINSQNSSQEDESNEEIKSTLDIFEFKLRKMNQKANRVNVNREPLKQIKIDHQRSQSSINSVDEKQIKYFKQFELDAAAAAASAVNFEEMIPECATDSSYLQLEKQVEIDSKESIMMMSESKSTTAQISQSSPEKNQFESLDSFNPQPIRISSSTTSEDRKSNKSSIDNLTLASQHSEFNFLEKFSIYLYPEAFRTK